MTTVVQLDANRCVFQKTDRRYRGVCFFSFHYKKVVQRVANRRYNCQNNLLQMTEKVYIVFRFVIYYVVLDNCQQPTLNLIVIMLFVFISQYSTQSSAGR